VVNTWGRINAEFYSLLEEVVSVVTTVLQMVKTISRTSQDGGFSDNQAPHECGCPWPERKYKQWLLPRFMRKLRHIGSKRYFYFPPYDRFPGFYRVCLMPCDGLWHRLPRVSLPATSVSHRHQNTALSEGNFHATEWLGLIFWL
jgi:hypothetical protein